MRREFVPTPNDHNQLVATIGLVTTDWVRQECVASVSGKNKYLDSVQEARTWLTMDYDNPANLLAAKHNSHHTRQKLFGEAMILDPEDDFFMGRHFYNCLQQVSGMAKRICYLAATDQEHYIELKTSPNVVGIDTTRAILRPVIESTDAGGTMSALDVEDLQAATMDVFAKLGEEMDAADTRIQDDFGRAESPTMDRFRGIQGKWVELVAISTLTAMSYRGGILENVPVLDTKSLSDGEVLEIPVHYPFK